MFTFSFTAWPVGCVRFSGLFRDRLGKAPGAFQKGPAQPFFKNFVNLENHLLKRGKLNRVAGDALIDLGDGSNRPEDVHHLVAVQVGAQDAIEADKVVDMMVRDEDRFQAGQLFALQVAQFAGVEEQGVVLAGIIDVQKRVAGGTVDQSAVRDRAGAWHTR